MFAFEAVLMTMVQRAWITPEHKAKLRPTDLMVVSELWMIVWFKEIISKVSFFVVKGLLNRNDGWAMSITPLRIKNAAAIWAKLMLSLK